ncbi:MAG: hypothetical protein KDB61_16240 [Planctomycetes bacterium]|nr:hypothetical protein [Planctomycetota bacterium]
MEPRKANDPWYKHSGFWTLLGTVLGLAQAIVAGDGTTDAALKAVIAAAIAFIGAVWVRPSTGTKGLTEQERVRLIRVKSGEEVDPPLGFQGRRR